jgi:hypothetical protein
MGAATSAAQPAGTAGPHDHGGTCTPTPEQEAAARKLLEDTRAAVVPRFGSTQAAVLAGYQPDPPPNAWWDRTFHYSNWNEWNDPAYLDPMKVESLVYGQTDRHGTILIGVMYAMPGKGQKGPEVGGCLTRWHAHENSEWGEALHVWFVDMPGGPFSPLADPEYVRQL